MKIFVSRNYSPQVVQFVNSYIVCFTEVGVGKMVLIVGPTLAQSDLAVL